MSRNKKFLLIAAAVSLLYWIVGNVLLGPPGLTKDYVAKYKHEHEHYLTVTKSAWYKLYAERPEVYLETTKEFPHQFQENVAFVESYAKRPEYLAQQRRIGWYELYFDVLNAGLLVVVAVFFGRRPLLSFLDARVSELKERLEEGQHKRNAAEARLQAANEQIAALPAEEERVKQATEEQVAGERSALDQSNQQSLEQLQLELEDRKRYDAARLALQVKREILDKAVEDLLVKFKAAESPALHAKLIDQVIENLEQQA